MSNNGNHPAHDGIGKPGQNRVVEKRGVIRAEGFVHPQPSTGQVYGHNILLVETRNNNPSEEAESQLQQQSRSGRTLRSSSTSAVSQSQNSNNGSSLTVGSSNSNHSMSTYQFGVADNIDERDAEDPLCATEYVQDMYMHFRSKEEMTSVRPLYMENQSHINERMRSILVDWLVEVHLKFKLVPETLYLTINLIDRYLERTEVSRPKLQLVGVTSLLIAAKYEEIYPPELRDLVYICDRAYTRQEVRLNGVSSCQLHSNKIH